MTIVVSLPFRQPGTSVPVLPDDRFNLETLQGFTRFQLPGGSDVIAMATGILNVRPPSAGLPGAVILRPLLPHRLTDRLPDRFATLRLLGIEQIIYTGLSLRQVSETACFTTRGGARRVVRRGARGRQVVRLDDFLAGLSVVRIERGELLVRGSTEFQFEVAVGLTATNEPYVADVMTLLAWWQEARLLEETRPSVLESFLPTPTPSYLPVLGPRSGDASVTLQCPETHVRLRRPPSDASLLPPELVRIGVGLDSQTIIITDPPRNDTMRGTLRTAPTIEVISIASDPATPGQFTLDPLNWGRLPAELQASHQVDLELVRAAEAHYGIGIRAFQPPPNPRGQGQLEPQHSDEWSELDPTGRYEEVLATEPWNGRALQINAAGRHVEVWLQTRNPLRSYHFAGDTDTRRVEPVAFALTGEELDLTGNPIGTVGSLNAILSVSSSMGPRSDDVTLNFDGSYRPFTRMDEAPRLADPYINSIQSATLRDYVAQHQRRPLTYAQEQVCRTMVRDLITEMERYFTHPSDMTDRISQRNADQVTAARAINRLIVEWFSSRTQPEQRLLALACLNHQLAHNTREFPLEGTTSFSGTAPLSAWLRHLLDEVATDTGRILGDGTPTPNYVSNARELLGLTPTPSTTDRIGVFYYRWKFDSLIGPELDYGVGVGVRFGVIRIQHYDPLPSADVRPPPGRDAPADSPVGHIHFDIRCSVLLFTLAVGPSFGGSVGEADADWDKLKSTVQWGEQDFVGGIELLTIDRTVFEEGFTPAGRVIFNGNGNHLPLSGDTSGNSMNFGLGLGISATLRAGIIFPPDEIRPPQALLPTVLFPDRVEVDTNLTERFDFATGEARLLPEGWARLRRLVATHLSGMFNPRTEISIVASASRLGSDIDNRILSERRAQNTQRAINDILGPISVGATRRARAQILDVVALGESPGSPAPGENPDNPDHRYVRVMVNGRAVLTLRGQ